MIRRIEYSRMDSSGMNFIIKIHCGNFSLLIIVDPLKETSENDNQFPEMTSKASTIDNEAKESPNKLIEKLSAALDVGSNVQNVNQDGNTNEQTPNEQDAGSNLKYIDQYVGVAEQSDDPDGNINKQFPKEHDVDAAEQNANQDGNANE
ncbi:hypothetical protein FXO37_13351 [Capsicum annuum]|nr:hypothetical protein FXO37_13351 [Capsicum annuum]